MSIKSYDLNKKLEKMKKKFYNSSEYLEEDLATEKRKEEDCEACNDGKSIPQ